VPQPLVDGFGRVHRDLRISVTDRCNFRCTYCMPAEGMDWLPRSELLTYEELERVARVFVQRCGFEHLRVTGGEPTVRSHLPVLIGKLAALGVDLALTTNGATLALVAEDLVSAGLTRVNVSLDSLRRDRFTTLTRRDGLDRVLEGIETALGVGLDPVKVNVVLVRGVNDDEIVDFATFGRETGAVVRFIEFMPLDASGAWRRDDVVSQAEIVETIDAVYPLEVVEGDGEPAERFRYVDGAGEVGVIPSVTNAFCGSCDRMRLTAEGQLRTCLFSLEEFDLREVLRSGGTDDEIEATIRSAISTKWAGHRIGQVTFIRPPRSMSQIGG
jgi:cyclic pyranopterin phosphate synthase